VVERSKLRTFVRTLEIENRDAAIIDADELILDKTLQRLDEARLKTVNAAEEIQVIRRLDRLDPLVVRDSDQ
jgi:hypothetical protein